MDPWQRHMRASRNCDRVTFGGSAHAGASARHHHPARTMTRRERVILCRAERAFERHDVVLPSARTWPEAPAWAGFHRGSRPGRSPHGEAHGTTHGTTHGIAPTALLNSANARADGVNASRVPERPVHSLGVKDSPAPAPSVSPRASSSPAATDTPECLLERVSARSGPVPTPCNGPCRGPARPSTQS